jgi:hypothetical protein
MTLTTVGKYKGMEKLIKREGMWTVETMDIYEPDVCFGTK